MPQPFHNGGDGMKTIFSHYLKPYYLRMAGGFTIKFTGTIMDLLLPWALAHMIDYVVPANKKGEILLWGLFMVLCSVLAVTFNILANRMAARVASDAIYTIRGDLFAKVMHLSEEYCDELTRPSLISRLTSDTYYVHQMIGRIQRLGVRAPILLVGGIVMTMILDPVLACVLLATLPLLTGVVYLVSRKSIPMFALVQESVDRFVGLVREDIGGIRVIKALSKEGYESSRFDRINKEVVEREKAATVTTAVTNPMMNALLNVGLVGVVVVGAYRVQNGTTEVGKILAFMTYFTIILTALLSISRMFIVVSKAAASASRIVKILHLPDERELSQGYERGEAAPESADKAALVQFDRVSFSYNKIQDNLSDISFSLKRGETLGIIGATGSGKSTIVNLLLRMYEADRGSIFIEGQKIEDIPLPKLRQRFGVVFQNDVIFQDSVLENIKIGRDLNKEEVDDALSAACADGFVKEKGGVDTSLGRQGTNLSGGQRQRILIARALAADPEILILDDSSSALDYKTEAELRNELSEHYSETTCIMIAQRISSVMNADRILVLEDGKTMGYGTHAELMEQCEIYQEIERSQMNAAQREVL